MDYTLGLGQPASWLAGWLAGWLTGWQAGWLAGWVAGYRNVACQISVKLKIRKSWNSSKSRCNSKDLNLGDFAIFAKGKVIPLYRGN